MQTPELSSYSLFSQGIFVDPMTPVSRHESLAKKLHPDASKFPLVRMGSNADGGYLIPDDLTHIKACFSPGVDNFATFESDLLKFGIGSHLTDYGVDKPPDGLQALSFTKNFLGANSQDHFVSLEDWVDEFEPKSPINSLLLQMDIEGAEYDTLHSCSTKTLSKFRIMVIEFHAIESWGHSDFLNIVEANFNKILNTHFIVHSSPNNEMGLADMNGLIALRIFELTFLSRKRASPGALAITPHPLDFPNVSNMPNLNWDHCWIQS